MSHVPGMAMNNMDKRRWFLAMLEHPFYFLGKPRRARQVMRAILVAPKR
ncbi:MAG: hypothetical protein IPG69_15685 [Flavobacteriales bacterium]|nr:hypothetical protein [Flavobacteriales bacterium]